MKSPGHRQDPDHEVTETRVDGLVTIELDGATVVDTADALRIDEDGQPPRYYVPLTAVEAHLEDSPKTTECKFKGKGHYYNVLFGDRLYENAAWTYDEPFDEHLDLAGRVAFDDDKIPGLSIH